MGDVGEELLHHLYSRLKEIFRHPCKVAPAIKLRDDLYSAQRGQYNAEDILKAIAKKVPLDSEKLLGIVDVDLFVEGMNFVFGLASRNIAVISLARLRPEYYGEKENELLFRERALKEAVHELGHTYGLSHCPDIRCVMHFSNCLEDTDIKGVDFCRNCSIRIRGGSQQ